MQGRKDLFFFSTKKNPAPDGEEEGQIMPAANELFIYASMVSQAQTGGRGPGKQVDVVVEQLPLIC